MPFKATFFDRVICPIPSTNEQGNPFKKWDGFTLGPNGKPSESHSANVRVYGDGSVYCVQLSLQQLYDLYYSTSLNANCKWDLHNINANVNGRSSGGTCSSLAVKADVDCKNQRGNYYYNVFSDTLPPAGEISINSDLASFLSNEAYQVKSRCINYPAYDPSTPNVDCDLDIVFVGDDLIKNTPDYVSLYTTVISKTTGYIAQSIQPIGSNFDSNQLVCLPYSYQDANILFMPKGKYSAELGDNYNPTGIKFDAWYAKMIAQFGSDILTSLYDIWNNPQNYIIVKNYYNFLNHNPDVYHYYPLPEYEIKGKYYAGALFGPSTNITESIDGLNYVYGEIISGGDIGYFFKGAGNGGYHSPNGTSISSGDYNPICVFVMPAFPFLGIDAIRVSDNEFWWNPKIDICGYMQVNAKAHGECPMPGPINDYNVICYNDPNRPKRHIDYTEQFCDGNPVIVESEESVSVAVSTRGYSDFNGDNVGTYNASIPIKYHQPYSTDIDPNRTKTISANMFVLVQAKNGISGIIDKNREILPQATSYVQISWNFSGLVPKQIDVYAHGWPDQT